MKIYLALHPGCTDFDQNFISASPSAKFELKTCISGENSTQSQFTVLHQKIIRGKNTIRISISIYFVFLLII